MNKNIFACLFCVHNAINLLRYEQVRLYSEYNYHFFQEKQSLQNRMIVSLERATRKIQLLVQTGLKRCMFFSTSSSRFSKLCKIYLEVSTVSIFLTCFGLSSVLNIFAKPMKLPIYLLRSFDLFCIWTAF